LQTSYRNYFFLPFPLSFFLPLLGGLGFFLVSFFLSSYLSSLSRWFCSAHFVKSVKGIDPQCSCSAVLVRSSAAKLAMWTARIDVDFASTSSSILYLLELRLTS